MLLVKTDNALNFQNQAFRCATGKGGFAKDGDKREGDGATPIGIYPLRAVYYRADKFAVPPETGLPLIAIRPDDGWCDDPADVNYNKPIKLPYAARHEKLWRDDDLYDLVVVMGHNDSPVIAGHGSCIFMHIARPDYTPTEGCIALGHDDLLTILQQCDSGMTIEISAPQK